MRLIAMNRLTAL